MAVAPVVLAQLGCHGPRRRGARRWSGTRLRRFGGGDTRGGGARGGGHGIRYSLSFPSAAGRVRIAHAEPHRGAFGVARGCRRRFRGRVGPARCRDRGVAGELPGHLDTTLRGNLGCRFLGCGAQRPAWSGTPRSLSAARPAHESVSRRTAERYTSHWNERRPGGGSMASSPRNSPWRWRRGADPWTL